MGSDKDRERVSFSLPKGIVQSLKDEARRRVLNESLLVEKALEMYLPLLPPIELKPLRMGAEDV